MATTPKAPPRRVRERAPRSRDSRHGRLGQSLAEFALTVPMALLMVLFGLDFGRVFLGWVALNQAAREAANFAAMNPTAWTLPYNIAAQAEYSRLVTTEADDINCAMPSPVPAPTFPNGTSLGAPAVVELHCNFSLITPVISTLIGNPIAVSASSAFPVRSGNIEGVPVASTAPTGTPAPTATAGPSPTAAATATVGPSAPPGSAAPAPTPAPTPTPTPTPVPTPTPAPTEATCTVVSLLNVQTNRAQSTWSTAGFTGAVIFSPLVPPNYRIQWQSLTVGSTIGCTSGITVRSNAP